MVRLFFTDTANLPFLWALVVLVAISFVVIVGALLGAIHLPEADGDLDVDWSHGHLGGNVLEFVGGTAMPLSMLLVVSSSTFFLVGYTTQMIVRSATGAFLSGWVVIAPALIVTILVCRSVGKLAHRSHLKMHTESVSDAEFLGRIATVCQGTARFGLPAQAKFRDQFGRTHYVLVEPRDGQSVYQEGTEVVLYERSGPKFLVTGASMEDILALEGRDNSNSTHQ